MLSPALTRRLVGLLMLILAPALVVGCSTSGGGVSTSMSAPEFDRAYPMDDEAFPSDGGTADGDSGEERMVIRSRSVRLEVHDATATVADIRDLVEASSGVVADMQLATGPDDWVYRWDDFGGGSHDGAPLRGWVTVRIPVDHYDQFVTDVKGLGKLQSESEAAEDVTQQHLDLSARLENLRAQEARLREFFEAATKVEDMLAIEVELGRVRGDIEAMDAQVKYLERRADMATVAIELVEPRPAVSSWGLGEAIARGLRGAVGVVNGLVTFVVASSPIWITGLVLFFVGRRWLRHRRGRKAREDSE